MLEFLGDVGGLDSIMWQLSSAFLASINSFRVNVTLISLLYKASSTFYRENRGKTKSGKEHEKVSKKRLK